MRRGSSLRSVVGITMVGALGLSACGDHASGETKSAAATTPRTASSPCPSVEQVSKAAGFEVTFTQAIGTNPDSWMGCQYGLTGRYRGTFITVTGEPASRADSIYGEMKERVKAINGDQAEADRLDLGSGGWAFGGDSKGEAAAVVGSHVYHVDFGYVGLGSLGDQKDPMVRVLKLFAH
jgi:hypothetical protein